MPTIQELVSGTEVELEIAEKRRKTALAERKLILETAASEGRSALTEDEQAQHDAAKQRGEQATKELAGIREKLTLAREALDEEAAIEKAQTERVDQKVTREK